MMVNDRWRGASDLAAQGSAPKDTRLVCSGTTRTQPKETHVLKQAVRFSSMAALIVALSACAGQGTTLPGSAAQAQVAPTSTPAPTAPALARPTVVVQRGSVEERLEFSGRWLPRDQVELAFEVAGNVRRVEIRRDDTVSAGQLLADLQIDELERSLQSEQLSLETALANLESGTESSGDSVADAQIALANARIQLESARSSRNWTSVASAELSLQDAERALDEAQRAYDEAISRADTPASQTTQAYQSLQDAQQRVRSAQISYWQAAQSYNNEEFNLAQQENSVIQAELRLQQAIEGGSSDPQALQNVRASQLRIDQLNAQIRQSSLYAPIDGVVLRVDIQPADQVQAFDAVITIGRPEPREVVAESVPFSDINRLNQGQIGVCQVANQDDTAVQCLIRRLPLASTDPDQDVRVAADMADLAQPGALIEVAMPLQVRENVLWLPPSAVRTFQGRRFVLIQLPDGERRVDVEVGLETDERAEIVSGLSEGDVVILP